MKIEIASYDKKRLYDIIVGMRNFYSPCGGKGKCGKCKIKQIEGNFNEVTESEKKFLTSKEIKSGVRLACYIYLEGKGIVDIEIEMEKIEKKTYIEYSEKENYIVICDMGTTTVEIEVYDRNKKLAAEIKFLNPQRRYGSDIIARAEFGSKSKKNMELLKNLLIEKLNKIEYIKSSKELYCAGNSVIQQIFMGISTQNFLELPYNPAFYEKKRVNSKEMKINMKDNGFVTTLENIGGFVGGDSRAIVEYYSRNKQKEKIFLVMDLGTNGEIILFKEEMVFAASTAAGPAFEAVAMECGMGAIEGSVSSVTLENGVELEIIGGGEPKGICGSGYISLISELIYTETLDKNGNFVEKNNLFPEINKNIFAGKFSISQYIYVSQKDIREIQSAKSAIATTVEILLEEAGLTENDVEKVVISGNFGGKVTAKSVEMCKILPKKMCGNINFETNLVLKGIKSMIVEEKDMEINYKVVHINTAEKIEFEKKFIKNMSF